VLMSIQLCAEGRGGGEGHDSIVQVQRRVLAFRETRKGGRGETPSSIARNREDLRRQASARPSSVGRDRKTRSFKNPIPIIRSRRSGNRVRGVDCSGNLANLRLKLVH